MNDDNFVSRWSRLKREAAQRRRTSPEAEARDERPSAGRDDCEAGVSAEERAAEPELDLASLPPIESIAAGTDIRAFLQKGVPAELTRAALRRAWTSDPAIRDFIGLAENQWDFTDPTAIPGFGVLQASDNVGQLVAQAMGKLPKVEDAVGLAQAPGTNAKPEADECRAAPQSSAPSSDEAVSSDDPADVELPDDVAAAQQSQPVEEGDRLPSRKGHGRALPT